MAEIINLILIVFFVIFEIVIFVLGLLFNLNFWLYFMLPITVIGAVISIFSKSEEND